MIGVVSLVAFPFPIDIPTSNFKPDINLSPFNFGYCDSRMLLLCFQNLYENILLTIPFGWGISFIARIKPRNIFWLALAVGFLFEFVQLIISLAIRSSFRIVDINDVMLNAAGVLIGYGLFQIFGWLYLSVIQRLNIQPKYIFAYVYDIVRPQNQFHN
ncbi:MAG: VanZ family protein [Chloroflexota bacterium]